MDDVNITRKNIEDNFEAFNFTSPTHINDYEKLLKEGFDVISAELAKLDQIFVDTKFEFGYVTDKAGKKNLFTWMKWVHLIHHVFGMAQLTRWKNC